MPILALPETTTRILCSSLVLIDARSVVKELVDNALDARATAISVEISNNTLDVIQVKDNGTGIDVQDRQLLCKRGCTSKIKSLEDLDRLGGSSLGFRGEALASIVELSHAVVVTTRVDGEVVGTSVKYAASGMLSSSSTSHPVGTTIRVLDFLSKIPVRKQTALKESMKTLQAIRLLLFSFAFARPEVRLSLKVLKGKNNKINWTYAPTPTPSIAEVATKILGKEIASECTPYKVSADDCDVELDNGWKINALLLSAAPGSANARNARQYISIDGRPVNTDRGTMREVAKSYKRHLQKTLPSSDSSSVSRPFLLMQIQCPPQSYDVNVEPTKDQVLFAQPSQLLSLVESLFGRAYSGLENRDIEISDNDKATPTPAIVTTSNQQTCRGGLTDTEGDGHLLQQDDFPVATDTAETVTPTSSVRNPFTIAAMTAQIKPRKMDSNQARATSDLYANILTHGEDVVTSENVSTTVTTSRTHSEAPSDNPNFGPSLSPRPGPPMRRPSKTSRSRENEASGTGISNDTNAISIPEKLDLQGWLTPKPESHPPSGSVSDTSPRSNTLLSPPFSSQMHWGWGAGQKPFKVPLRRKIKLNLPVLRR
ncbi:hypothetical protein CLAIMM_00233 [Cladophialophora immunda]|nr:hypothetical protein CLAIMM_00233 [Cladophialophora immunda]